MPNRHGMKNGLGALPAGFSGRPLIVRPVRGELQAPKIASRISLTLRAVLLIIQFVPRGGAVW